jgi:hypothetical protein
MQEQNSTFGFTDCLHTQVFAGLPFCIPALSGSGLNGMQRATYFTILDTLLQATGNPVSASTD